ncbi:MAG: DUF551 domain-containing protein [Oscillospiraceae bacterium]|nr:DUF551 domain-containing protein [Oscillospiraceae bacterium]MDY5736099.1 DUF551 domain-containing protein [Oscillospiraceae bacterium]
MATMDVREKLVDILKQAPFEGKVLDEWWWEEKIKRIADHLIRNGVTVQEWISVKERLPQEKVDCIVHYKHAYCDNDDYWAIGMCFYDGEKFQLNPAYKVTHWMPMPQPPKGE